MESFNKRKIDVLEHAGEIIKALQKGILVTTKNGKQLNTMTISWGKLGIEWHRPVFITYIRGSRFTYENLLKSGEFSVNINPDHSEVSKILAYCGSKSGRDTDKFSDMNLTPVSGNEINTPGIKEFPLTLECKVIYQQKQEREAIPEKLRKQFYPNDNENDYHTMFFGEIVGAHIIE